MAKKLKNLVKALAISIPIILSNPLKAQKYNTIAHKVIEITGEVDSTNFTYKNLNNFLDNVNANIKFKKDYTEKEAKERLIKINKYININREKVYDPCFKKTIFYLSVKDLAESKRKTFPIYAIYLPPIQGESHTLLRWDQDGKHNSLDSLSQENQGDFNFETTLPDSLYENYSFEKNTGNLFFKDKFLLEGEEKGEKIISEKKGIENKIYMHNLNKKQILAEAYVKNIEKLTLENENLTKQQKELIIEIADKALELDSNSTSALHYKAYALFNLEEYFESLKNLNKIITLAPYNGIRVERNWALLWLETKDKEKFKKELKRLIEIGEIDESTGKKYLEK